MVRLHSFCSLNVLLLSRFTIAISRLTLFLALIFPSVMAWCSLAMMVKLHSSCSLSIPLLSGFAVAISRVAFSLPMLLMRNGEIAQPQLLLLVCSFALPLCHGHLKVGFYCSSVFFFTIILRSLAVMARLHSSCSLSVYERVMVTF